MSDHNAPRVVCAAVRDGSGQVVCGPRHFDLRMHRTIENLMDFTAPWEQGFVDQFGRFLTRTEARQIAEQAGQIIRRVGGDATELFSENLY